MEFGGNCGKRIRCRTFGRSGFGAASWSPLPNAKPIVASVAVRVIANGTHVQFCNLLIFDFPVGKRSFAGYHTKQKTAPCAQNERTTARFPAGEEVFRDKGLTS